MRDRIGYIFYRTLAVIQTIIVSAIVGLFVLTSLAAVVWACIELWKVMLGG